MLFVSTYLFYASGQKKVIMTIMLLYNVCNLFVIKGSGHSPDNNILRNSMWGNIL